MCRWYSYFLPVLIALGTFCGSVQADGSNQTLVFTEEFLFSRIGKEMLQLPQNLKRVLNGTLKRAPTSPKKVLNLTCLNSVAPPPLNWKMWCPASHAKVTEWVDDVGSTHRLIVLKPMPSMTARKAVWFMTPMFPTHLNVSGKLLPKHYLWHPLDHTAPLDFKLAPGKTLLAPPTLMTKMNEVYRTPPKAQPPSKRPYQTSLWLSAADLALNLPRNRYVLGFEVMGFQAFSLLVEFNDSPEGLVVSVEVILGAAARGFDPKNPLHGSEPGMAALANAMLLEPLLGPFKETPGGVPGGQVKGALDAITRHVVEEFGNLQWFVPAAWEASVPGKAMAELETFKANLVAATSALPVQFASGDGES